MLFRDVIGHEQAKKVLQNALTEDRVAHAYLFHGPEGVGKTTLARAFAQAMLCDAGGDEACGDCSICRRFVGGQLPDFFVLHPSGNSIKIEQVRELQKKAQFKPYEAKRKVYIISRAETMTREAANCLLRVLEDPPAYTVFLLTVANSYNLLPTIISRCQLIPLARISSEQITEMLIKNNGVDRDAAALIATLSDGLPGAAKEIVESGAGLEARTTMLEMADLIIDGGTNRLLKAAESLEKKKDILPEVLEQLLVWYRDMLLLYSGNGEMIVNIDKKEQMTAYLKKFGKNYLIRSVDDILEAKRQINQNVNVRLLLEVLLLKLTQDRGSLPL